MEMNDNVAHALYQCGPGVIDYTCGVLDAIGQCSLSFRLRQADARHKVAIAERNQHTGEPKELLFDSFANLPKVPQDVERRYRETREELSAAIDELMELQKKAAEYTAIRTGGGIS
jgi:hypothetical protein